MEQHRCRAGCSVPYSGEKLLLCGTMSEGCLQGSPPRPRAHASLIDPANPDHRKNSVCGSMNRPNRRKTVAATDSPACQCKKAGACSADCTGNCTGTREQLPSGSPVQQAALTGIAGCWLRPFCWGVRRTGVLQAVCDARRAELLRYYLEAWQGCLHRAVCRDSTAFSMEYLTRPCGQPVSGIEAACP